MANYKNNSRINVEPYQMLPIKKKNDEWRENNVDYIISRSGLGAYNSMTRKGQMKISYDLYNSVFKEDDFKHITDPYKVSDGFPATLQNFNIIKPKIDLLEGEATKRPFPFKIIQTNEEATSKLQEKYKSLLFSTIMEIAATGDSEDPVTEEEVTQVEKIGEYMSRDFSDIGEQQAYHTINYLREKEDLKEKFLRNFHDLLCANTIVGYVGQVNGEPIYERVNPLYFSCDSSPESGYTEDGDWAAREMQMTASGIYDRFYDMTTESKLKELLEKFNYGGESAKSTDTDAPSGISWREGPNTDKHQNYFNDSTITVWHVTWKSLKKIGFLTYTDEDEVEQVDIVDESYTASDDESITWDWVSEIWEGYRIGEDLYLGMRPLPEQTISLDNPNSNKLPYVGTIFTYKNTESKSLVEIMKPLQYLYIAIMYQLQLTMARDKGKIITVDVTQIPKSLGIDANKWLHYLSSTNVNFINPYECLKKGTNIIMADSSIRKIEDVHLGDEVMGPDGKSRKVLHTHEGLDRLFKIKHRSGANDHVVNSAHPNYYFEKDYYKKEYKPLIKNALDLLLENEETPYKSKLRYTKRATNIDSDWNRDLKLDPYFLGLWLGDGTTGKPAITNADFEIASYLEGFAKFHNLKMGVYGKDLESKAKVYNLGKGPGIKNPLKEVLNSYGILNKKDIPEDYIYSSREDRLKLLAGLIDTDGCYHERDQIYTFSQSEDRKHIVEKAAFIARSLGFKCSVKKYGELEERYLLDSDNISICQPTYKLSILDWDIKIPTLIERKQADIPNKNGDKDYSNFSVEYEGIGEFYGIHIDGDHLFVLDDFTIVHNTGWDTPGREGGKPAQTTQFGQTDLSMSNVVVQYIQLMNKIEEMIGELSGVSRQRQGQVQSSELVGNVQQTIVQSSHITEYLFYTHTQYMKRVYTQLLNTAKKAWANSSKEKLHYLTDDMVRIFMDITDDFLYSDMDIFVSDSTQEHNNVEALKQLAQPAMQNGASLLDVAEIFTSNNLTDIKNKLSRIEAEKQKREEQMMQMQQQAQVEQSQMMAQVEQGKQELENRKLDIDESDSIRKADTSIQVALIQADSKEAIEESKRIVDYDKLNTEYSSKEMDNDLKNRELAETKRNNSSEEAIKRVAANKKQSTSN